MMTSFLKHVLLFMINVVLMFGRNGFCLNTDTIHSTLILKDSDTIHSSGNISSLGFFSPNGTTNRYVGIWFSVSPEVVVWVANRDNPINDTSGTVSLSADGNIVVMNGAQEIIWSAASNLSISASNNTSVRLLDSGNLVLQDSISGLTVWESFKHPTDTFMPGIRPSHNPRTGARVSFSSWRTVEDPAPGNFTWGISAFQVPQVYVWERNTTVPRWRSGPWNGRIFIGVSRRTSVFFDGFTVATDRDGTVSVSWGANPEFGVIRVNATGFVVNDVWNDSTKEWDLIWPAPATNCDLYNHCGPFAYCYIENSPICSCLRGYEPRSVEEWNRGIWRGGCTRKTMFQCERNGTNRGREDGFLEVTYAKVPENPHRMDGLEVECQGACLGNCSCLAYAYDLGTGCMFWDETLEDVQKFSDGSTGGFSLYVRVPYSMLDKTRRRTLVFILSGIGSVIAASICLLGAWWICKKKRAKRLLNLSKPALLIDMDAFSIDELSLLSFEVLANATNNFDEANKLGRGGFGPVFKGTMIDNKEIAVKRLSAVSGQGIQEFMNEVIVISKLQHRNLVRLLGCCVHGEEKMLVYEYVPNKSLDFLLFDKRQHVLDWKKSFNIIQGIARGLLYLHRDSRLRIIHRDLKPSNVLLDEEWNPKISDFGMARIFEGTQDQAETAKVVGTYGYMAPEYVIGGIFSEKSDVFSFGVIMLEIISGRKNTSFYNDESSLSLLGHTWKLWNEDKALDLIDNRIFDPSIAGEILRCMHIGLLCVQEFHGHRPTIPTIVSMLSSEIVDLPIIGRPGFTEGWHVGSTPPSLQSANRVTITMFEGR